MRSSIRHILLVALAATVVSLLGGSVAMASPDKVLSDCAKDGIVDGDYSDKDLEGAIKKIPTDLDEYSDCRALINAQVDGDRDPVAGAASKKGGNDFGGGDGEGGSGGVAGDSDSGTRRGGDGGKGSAAGSRARRELARQDTEERVGDKNVDPTSTGVFEEADSSSGLPTPVLVALIALAVLLAGGTFMAVKRRPALPGVLRRVRLPRFKR